MGRLPRGGEFRALWLGEACSVVGDQLAKVAIALLVFDRTGSAWWSGLAYALPFLVPLVAMPALAPLADRFPRRRVMVVCCLAQAGCVALMAVPGLPVAALVAGTMAVAAIQIPFKGAQGATIRAAMPLELNKSARARLTLVRELGQLGGLAGAAPTVLLLGTGPALLVDAVTFLAAAVLIHTRVRHRPVTAAAAGSNAPLSALAGQIRRSRAVRVLLTLVALIGVTAAPSAVMAPLIAEIHAPDWTLGPLLAADCLGVALGAAWLERQPAARQLALIFPLTAVSLLPLALVVLRPGSVLLLGALLLVSGIGSAYFVLALSEATERLDESIAGSANGLMSAIVRVTQGVGAAAAGALGRWFTPQLAVGLLGLFGLAVLAACAMSWRRVQVA